MRTIVRKIDRALKELYGIEHAHRAEDYLIRRPVRVEPSSAGNAGLGGALFVRNTPHGTPLSIAIYLSRDVRRRLISFRRWPKGQLWSREQLQAFSVAAEEVSHFEYLLYHVGQGRPVTQLELEIQGEIDKFFLTYFALYGSSGFNANGFQRLFDQFFTWFHLHESLNDEQRARYLEANRLARRFLLQIAKLLSEDGSAKRALPLLRRVYRMNVASKIGLIGG